ncbi:MAG TPA: TPM domain-containing protein [Candidatus Limnocylindrales bacterium]|jgi:Beta-propeller domains of methanol dehydrogenase type|nr:TPM domain-containing protein [Candidatus Limnocylindrales bacterium]
MRPYRRLAAIGFAAAAVGAWLAVASVATAAPPAGPPYPDAVTGQRVYDYAGIFSPGAISQTEQTILGIEQRTGAQVAVYTQVKPESDTLDKANADALALMNQWGVGRKGFDDGLVILFDMQANRQHGQVSLYAGSGFRSAFLTDSDRQSIFDNDMKPLLKTGDFDGALKAAVDGIDAAATPGHADQLNQARIFNAIVGLGALALAIFLVAFVLIRWHTHGRDPIYVDDNSVLMPAPPDGLTPAMATLLMDDRTSSRTVSAAMVDLAARGLIQFRQEEAFLSKKTSVGVTGKTATIGTPEADIYSAICTWVGPDGFVETGSMPQLASATSRLKSDLETLAVQKGWLTGRPSRVVGLWIVIAVAEGIAAIPLIVWTLTLEASGGLLGGVALIVAAVITGVTAWFMPSRTRIGAMLWAMLAAYKRTLQYTMAQAQTMDQVVESKALPWVSTPDEAMAWGVAFGLNAEIDAVLRRSVETSAATGRAAGWYPMWWIPVGGHSLAGGVGGASGSGAFSPSAIPDVGSMMSAIGSIGASTSHSGGGGFGGGGGGGGGGAGGGF